MRVEFWEGKLKRGEADLAVPPQVNDRVTIGTATYVVGSPPRWVLGSPPHAVAYLQPPG